MSPIEHYLENLLVMGSDLKGEPNKNALSKEVQEAVEICADYIKNIQYDSNAEKVAMLEELHAEIKEKATEICDDGWWLTYNDIIQQKINALKGDSDDK